MLFSPKPSTSESFTDNFALHEKYYFESKHQSSQANPNQNPNPEPELRLELHVPQFRPMPLPSRSNQPPGLAELSNPARHPRSAGAGARYDRRIIERVREMDGCVQFEVGGGEDVGGAEADGNPREHAAGVVPLEKRPVEALRVERVPAVEPRGGQGVAELLRAHRRRRLALIDACAEMPKWENGGAAGKGKELVGPDGADEIDAGFF